jgi:hypothetical protein
MVNAGDCSTATLEITLNKENRASKETVLQVMAMLAKAKKPITMVTDENDALSITLLAEFPVEGAAPVESATGVTTTQISHEAAENEDEWIRLQHELASVNGVLFACSKSRPSGIRAATEHQTPPTTPESNPSTESPAPAEPPPAADRTQNQDPQMEDEVRAN